MNDFFSLLLLLLLFRAAIFLLAAGRCRNIVFSLFSSSFSSSSSYSPWKYHKSVNLWQFFIFLQFSNERVISILSDGNYKTNSAQKKAYPLHITPQIDHVQYAFFLLLHFFFRFVSTNHSSTPIYCAILGLRFFLNSIYTTYLVAGASTVRTNCLNIVMLYAFSFV